MKTAFAENMLGTVAGSVRDNNGAAVTAAEAGITAKATGESQEVKADAAGNFGAACLKRNVYSAASTLPAPFTSGNTPGRHDVSGESFRPDQHTVFPGARHRPGIADFGVFSDASGETAAHVLITGRQSQ